MYNVALPRFRSLKSRIAAVAVGLVVVAGGLTVTTQTANADTHRDNTSVYVCNVKSIYVQSTHTYYSVYTTGSSYINHTFWFNINGHYFSRTITGMHPYTQYIYQIVVGHSSWAAFGIYGCYWA